MVKAQVRGDALLESALISCQVLLDLAGTEHKVPKEHQEQSLKKF